VKTSKRAGLNQLFCFYHEIFLINPFNSGLTLRPYSPPCRALHTPGGLAVVTSFNSKIQQAYVNDLSNNIPKLEKKASDAIRSFAELVSELNKVNKLSTGTPVKDQISKLTGELNNSSVFFAKMIGDELNKLSTIVNSDGQTPEKTEV